MTLNPCVIVSFGSGRVIPGLVLRGPQRQGLAGRKEVAVYKDHIKRESRIPSYTASDTGACA